MLVSFLMGTTYAQNKDLKKSREFIADGKFQSALGLLNIIPQKKLSGHDMALYSLLKAKAYSAENAEDSAYYYYVTAKQQYHAIDSTEAAMKINLQLAYLAEAHSKKFELHPQEYLDEYLDYAMKIKDPLTLANAYTELASIKINPKEYNEALRYFEKARQINKSLKNKKLESQINNNLAAIYNEHLHQPDSALYYLKKDLEYLKTKKNNTYDLTVNYINQAVSHIHKKEYETSNELLNLANRINVNQNRKGLKVIIYDYLAQNNASLGNFKEAYNDYLKYQAYTDSLNIEEQAIAVADIETRYRTTEKELRNKVLESDNNTNRIIIYVILGVLLAILVIGYLIVKNARRREKIAAQEKLIEQQKLEKALKDYELQSIDLMLEGQEKERERIANDLHDNLGSMLATLKLNFENLKLRKNELAGEENKLYERTDELIEEAYQKVRRIAHAKNAGVIANKGLLPAIKKLAEKLTLPGKLSFQVVDFGFDERLENTLEIAIFRMVQELATNIIKHSQATEATIQLTHHEDNINIIIEDNGVGFSPDGVKPDSGMGLDSIRKKVIQLGGTFSIDSTPGKGTTIVIDIPV